MPRTGALICHHQRLLISVNFTPMHDSLLYKVNEDSRTSANQQHFAVIFMQGHTKNIMCVDACYTGCIKKK